MSKDNEREAKLMDMARALARAYKDNLILATYRPSVELLANAPNPRKSRKLEQIRYDRFLDPKCRLNRIESMLLDIYEKKKPVWEIP